MFEHGVIKRSKLTKRTSQSVSAAAENSNSSMASQNISPKISPGPICSNTLICPSKSMHVMFALPEISMPIKFLCWFIRHIVSPFAYRLLTAPIHSNIFSRSATVMFLKIVSFVSFIFLPIFFVYLVLYIWCFICSINLSYTRIISYFVANATVFFTNIGYNQK